MTDAPPTNLGRYRILAELGRGAMGVVYKAQDSQLERTVAIKTIRMSSDSSELAEYLARFHQEGKALGGMNHPGIITVFDIGREKDIAYMAMELLDGVELRDLMAQSRLPLRLVVDLAAQIADGLAFAHERGVVHRDIKPANIMIVHGDRAKIMDFGIARVRVSDIKTQTGMLLGSPKYMSPEQIVGRPVDHRSDIFSLGVVLYEMLAGIAPFAGGDLTQVMFQVVNSGPVPPSRVNPATPEVLDFIVAKALEKDPENRYQNAGELASDLRVCRDALPNAPPPATTGDTLPLADTLPLSAESASSSAAALKGSAPIAPLEANVPRTAKANPRASTIAGSTTLAGASLGLLLSSQYDSTRALARLTRPSASDRMLLSPSAPAPARNRFARFRHDTDLVRAVAVLGVAAVIALFMAVI